MLLDILNVAFVIIGICVTIGVSGVLGVGTLGTLPTVIDVFPLGHIFNFLLKWVLGISFFNKKIKIVKFRENFSKLFFFKLVRVLNYQPTR